MALVVIPAAHLEHVATAGPEQERLEEWIMGEVEKGLPLPGLYPADAATRVRYEAERGNEITSALKSKAPSGTP